VPLRDSDTAKRYGSTSLRSLVRGGGGIGPSRLTSPARKYAFSSPLSRAGIAIAAAAFAFVRADKRPAPPRRPGPTAIARVVVRALARDETRARAPSVPSTARVARVVASGARRATAKPRRRGSGDSVVASRAASIIARVSAVGDDARGGVKTRLRAAFSHFDAFRRISRDISRRRRVERAARRASRSDGALCRASRSGADAEGARARARGGREEKRERETRGGFVNRRENTK
jgi:hypothetical protein